MEGGGGSLWVHARGGGGGGEGELLVKHRCLVVRGDPLPWTVHRSLISPSSEKGSKGELAVFRGPRQAPPPSYRLGIDMVP